MKTIRNCLIIILTIGIFSSCNSEEPQIRGVILPHHNLVGKYIDEFYLELANQLNDIDRVILISTNHFDIGKYYIQGASEFVKSIHEADLRHEHGVTVHIEYLEKHFPEVEVIPIIIKWATPEKQLNQFIDEVLETTENSDLKTLVIASIDFSHYIDEKVALMNDERTIDWLKKWGNGEFPIVTLDMLKELEKSIELKAGANSDYTGEERPTAMDSPETLYVFTKLMEPPQKADIWKRTSSASVFKIKNPSENTSHLFVKVW